MPYLAQLLAGYRRGLVHDPPESCRAVRAALVKENDAYRRGVLLGLLANSLTQPGRSSSTIGEASKPRRAVTEPIQNSLAIPSRTLAAVMLTEDLRRVTEA